MSLLKKSIKELSLLLKNEEITREDLVKESFGQIKKSDDQIGAFLALRDEQQVISSKHINEKNNTGSPLEGLPWGAKDNLSTIGVTTTCGSKILKDYKPIYNAAVVDKLETAGSVMIGKTNMDEFAMGSSNENSAFREVRNPHNHSYVPGGSSGGSAAAVASNQVVFALGSDTGGSVRQPASLCGVVGLKPTYGLVSRYGLIAFASSLDQIGPLTKSVEDSAYVLQGIAGYDPKDSTSIRDQNFDYLKDLNREIKGLKIGVPKELMGEGTKPYVKEEILKALKKLEDLGALVEEVSLPNSQYGVAAYYLIAPAEASSNLARYDGIRYGTRSKEKNLWGLFTGTRSNFGGEVKRRIMLGTYALSSGYYDAYYLQAQKIRTLIKRDYAKVFADFDLIIGPTTPDTAFKLGEDSKDPLTLYMKDVCTVPANFAGIPALSMPCGFHNNLPVGLQITGPALSEAKILNLGHVLEKELAL